MVMTRLIGVLAIIPATILLTISFFALFAIRRTDTHTLKAFGYVIAGLLWLSALLVFSLGIYTVATGRHPAVCMMREMMCMPRQGMMQGAPGEMMPGCVQMMKDKMPGMMHKAPADMGKKQ